MWALTLMKLRQMQKAKYNYNLLNLIIIEHKRRNKSTVERMLLAENIFNSYPKLKPSWIYNQRE